MYHLYVLLRSFVTHRYLSQTEQSSEEELEGSFLFDSLIKLHHLRACRLSVRLRIINTVYSVSRDACVSNAISENPATLEPCPCH